MNEKEKQIKELTQEIEFAKKGLWNAENLKKEDYSWHSRGIAVHLFDIGYTKNKIPEGSVVLSKEEYQELEELRLNHAKDLINANKLYEERIADLKIEFSNHIKNLERKIDRRDRDLNSQADRLINLKEELSQARKETAKEILQELVGHTFEDDGWTWTVSKEYIQWLAEKYDVEVEE